MKSVPGVVRRRGAQIAMLGRAIPQMIVGGRRKRGTAPLRIHFVYRDLGAPARYRVANQIEQAALAGFDARDVPIDGALNPYDLAACDLLYLYRLELTPRTWPLLVAARRRSIPVVFDSDDLVWDAAERTYSFLDDHYRPAEVRRILRTIGWMRAMMQRADAFVFSTPFLARRAARDFPQPAFVNPNALSGQQANTSERAYLSRHRSDDAVVIGYFSGHPVHDEDLASVTPALCAVLDRYPQARFRTYGTVRLAGMLAEPHYAARVEQRPLVRWEALPEHIAGVDINIAPLVDNPQRRAKSAVKYLEAGLVGVPTVATRLDPYQHDIAPGSTGFLAGTIDEWQQRLGELVGAPSLRRKLGDAARADALARHTTAARAPHFAAVLQQVVP